MTNKYLEKIAKDTGKSIITGAILGGGYGLANDDHRTTKGKIKNVLRSTAAGAIGSGVASAIYNKLPANLVERGAAKVKALMRNVNK